MFKGFLWRRFAFTKCGTLRNVRIKKLVIVDMHSLQTPHHQHEGPRLTIQNGGINSMSCAHRTPYYKYKCERCSTKGGNSVFGNALKRGHWDL